MYLTWITFDHCLWISFFLHISCIRCVEFFHPWLYSSAGILSIPGTLLVSICITIRTFSNVGDLITSFSSSSSISSCCCSSSCSGCCHYYCYSTLSFNNFLKYIIQDFVTLIISSFFELHSCLKCLVYWYALSVYFSSKSFSLSNIRWLSYFLFFLSVLYLVFLKLYLSFSNSSVYVILMWFFPQSLVYII